MSAIGRTFHSARARNIRARPGFTDYDAFGHGFVAAQTHAGCLDAPDYIPNGSVRVWNTIVHAPGLSHSLRETEYKYRLVGQGSDGPEAPTIRDGLRAMSPTTTMRSPQLRLSLENELIVDQFAGGGGASLGIELALGRSPDIAINHDPEAVALHAANHPTTRHFCESVWDVDPVAVCNGRPVGLMWLSPDCKHFSKAKGGKPVEKKIRGLAWIAVKWARTVKPRVIILENVEEFQDWGPLTADNMPCPERRGLTFRRWVRQLENCGYRVEWRELRACDYGAPTIRKRLFLVARCDGQPITWPAPTHAAKPTHGLKPWRTAAECIDWSIPCPSIFERERPLALNTLKRIAVGIKRYVIDAAKPFIVPVLHAGDARVYPIDEPARTITGQHRGEQALVSPVITRIGQTGGNGKYANAVDTPLTTITSKAEHLMVAPTLINTRNGEREGQAPRVRDIEQPCPTVTAHGSQGALVSAFLAQHNTGMVGHDAREPVSTIVGKGCTQAIIASHLTKLYGTNKDGQALGMPMPTIRAGGTHVGEVRAFLTKYYGTQQDPNLREPMHTVRTKDCFALVTVNGEQYEIADIGMRMLVPRELYRAQGFPDDYRIDIEYRGKPLTKTAQVRMCGNSVCPPLAAAIVAANYAYAQQEQAAA